MICVKIWVKSDADEDDVANAVHDAVRESLEKIVEIEFYDTVIVVPEGK